MWEEVKKTNLIERGTLIGNRLFSVETMGKNGTCEFLWKQRKASQQSSKGQSPLLDDSVTTS